MAVVTISRRFGSGGDEIAGRVCELLGYRYFEKALMAQVATEMGLAEGEIVDFSEDTYEMRSFLERLFRTPRKITQLEAIPEDRPGSVIAVVEKLDEAHSIALVQSTIQAASHEGNVVIVGRGGQAILKDKPDVLHVRVEAPLDNRVHRLCDRANFSLGGAHDMAIKRDRASADYLKRFYDIDWADSLLYDLVINTGRVDIEAAAQLIVKAVSYLPKKDTI
jgi:cytidylate kinase